jgi:hypothetical protein
MHVLLHSQTSAGCLTSVDVTVELLLLELERALDSGVSAKDSKRCIPSRWNVFSSSAQDKYSV